MVSSDVLHFCSLGFHPQDGNFQRPEDLVWLKSNFPVFCFDESAFGVRCGEAARVFRFCSLCSLTALHLNSYDSECELKPL